MKNAFFTFIGTIYLACSAFASGTVNNLTQADLETALAGGGTVLFGTNGTLTLTNTITVPVDSTLDANGHSVVISGGNAVRLFQVNSNVTFSANDLILANGRVVGANGANGNAASPGQGAGSAAILNLHGSIILNGCTLTNNSVQGGAAGQNLTNTNPNTANGGFGRGAAISSLYGMLHLTNCLFVGNFANGGIGSISSSGFGPADYGASGDAAGGAVYCEGGSLVAEAVVFSGNSATGGVAAVASNILPSLANAGRGGNAYGGALYATNANVLLNSSTSQSNIVSGGQLPVFIISAGNGSGDGVGGAVFLSKNATGQFRLCRFESDLALGGNGSRLDNAGAGAGGHIYNAGSLEVWDSTLLTGQSSGGGLCDVPGSAKGGAIYSTGTLILNGCALLNDSIVGGSANSRPFANMLSGATAEGGAVWSSGVLACTNSTIAGCWALGGSGGGQIGSGPGGAATGGGLYVTNATALLVSVTVAVNRADGTNIYSPLFLTNAGPALGGNLAATNATVTILNSILANSGNGGDVWGSVTDRGYNICSDGSAKFSAAGSRNQTDPLLSALSNNGGPAPTMALLIGSPARDAIVSGFPPTDQRGVSRPQGPAADIGAFEADFISAAPAIVTQPIAQTVRAGTNVTFTVDASGTGPLYYQWRKDGNPIGGATSSILSLLNVQANNAGTYSTLVTNAFGNVTSQGAMLNVDSTPNILVQPVSVVVSAGAATNFTVVAGRPSLTYQWWHDSALVPAGTAATLNIPNASAGAQGTYFVVVSNFANTITSTVATLSFDSSALSVLVPPKNLTLEAGYPASFSVLVSGVPPFAYQWERNGQAIPGATSSSYTISAVTTNFAGTYDVVVTNGYRSITSQTALLTVTAAATPPLLAPARFGQSLTMTFSAQAGRTYRLLSSTNFAIWSSVATNTTFSAGPLQFVEPITAGPPVFYRVVTP